jgi:GntR family transcriptional regulator/MocR family aminotransferase
LPPSRALAVDLGVSRGVVTDVYAQLAAEGYLKTRRGSGTKVSQLAMPRQTPSPASDAGSGSIDFDLRPGQPDFDAFPRKRWQAEVARALRVIPSRALTYPDPLGIGELRTAVSDYVTRVRGVDARADSVIIGPSTTYGISTIWRALRELGARRVGIENPGWRWQSRTVQQAGLQAVPIAVDEAGLMVDELDAAKVDAICLTPAHQYPTGVVMTSDRRSAVVGWARRRGALIVEDDYDAEFRYERTAVAALQGLAPDLIAFCGTLSKTLVPALRLAWMVVPRRIHAAVSKQYADTWPGPSVIDQLAAASFIERGELDRHIRTSRRRYRLRRDALVSTLSSRAPELRIGGVAAGLHVIAWLNRPVDDVAIASSARDLGLAVHSLHHHCFATDAVGPALVLGYASLSEPQLRRGAAMLANLVRAAQ